MGLCQSKEEQYNAETLGRTEGLAGHRTSKYDELNLALRKHYDVGFERGKNDRLLSRMASYQLKY